MALVWCESVVDRISSSSGAALIKALNFDGYEGKEVETCRVSRCVRSIRLMLVGSTDDSNSPSLDRGVCLCLLHVCQYFLVLQSTHGSCGVRVPFSVHRWEVAHRGSSRLLVR